MNQNSESGKVFGIRFKALWSVIITLALTHTLPGGNIDVYDSTGGVTDYRLSPGDTLTVHGDALTDDVCVWLNGGELRIANDVTIAATITQDVASVIFIEGSRNVKFTGTLSVAGVAAGNNLVITGDVASTESEITFSGLWDTATMKDSIYIKTGSSIFTNGTFMVGGYLYWEAQAGNVVVANDATFDVSDREESKPSLAYIPWFRPFSDGKVFEVRAGGIMRFGPYRQFLVGCGTTDAVGGASNSQGWTSTLRMSGGDILWYGQGTSSQNPRGTTFDGIVLYGKRSNNPNENHASVFDFAGGNFSAGGSVVRYGSWNTYQTYIKVKWSGGTWKVAPNYYGNANFTLARTIKDDDKLNMPCEITGDVALDLTAVKNGKGSNQRIGPSTTDEVPSSTGAGSGRWIGRDTASLMVNGGGGNGAGRVTMYSFHPNGMGLVLSNRASFLVHEFDRGEQRFRSIDISADSSFQTTANVILATVGAEVPPAECLLAPQVDVVQDAEGTLGTVRLSLTYGQAIYANARFAPVVGGELYLMDVPDGTDVREYVLPVAFDSITNSGNIRSWAVYVNGSLRKNLVPYRDASGDIRIAGKGFVMVFR